MNMGAISEIEKLGLTLIGEARGEPIEGQVAVGCVIRNRLRNHPEIFKDYESVIFQRKQFTCWDKNDVNRALLEGLIERLTNSQELKDPYFRQCMFVARGIIEGWIVDNTKGSENYMTQHLYYSTNRPSWAAHPKINPIIHGHQVFLLV